jgi:enoyl-CoA hydratase/carnithine racemase
VTEDLIVVEPGAIATIWLNNPPLNLVSKEVTAALSDALRLIAADDEVRAVVLAGTGDRAFSAGSDVKEFPSLQGRVGEGKLIEENAVYNQLSDLPVPTVAAIEGNALGGGLELALCCDLRVASRTALLGMPEVRLGVMPGSGGTQRLPRLIGLARAKELILLGEVIDADTALQFGLVNRVVPDGEAKAIARELAETLAARGPVAVREAKAALNTTLDRSLAEGQVAELAASERVFSSDDMLEGAAAFIEKRPAEFRNR